MKNSWNWLDDTLAACGVLSSDFFFCGKFVVEDKMYGYNVKLKKRIGRQRDGWNEEINTRGGFCSMTPAGDVKGMNSCF